MWYRGLGYRFVSGPGLLHWMGVLMVGLDVASEVTTFSTRVDGSSNNSWRTSSSSTCIAVESWQHLWRRHPSLQPICVLARANHARGIAQPLQWYHVHHHPPHASVSSRLTQSDHYHHLKKTSALLGLASQMQSYCPRVLQAAITKVYFFRHWWLLWCW